MRFRVLDNCNPLLRNSPFTLSAFDALESSKSQLAYCESCYHGHPISSNISNLLAYFIMSLFSSTTGQTGGGLFGSTLGANNTQNQSTGGGLFGATGQNNQSQPQQTGGLFGQSTQQNQPQQSGGLFGNLNRPQQQTQSTGGLFGQSAQQTGGLFGGLGQNSQQNQQQQQPQQQASSLFGGLGQSTQQNQQQGTSGGLFSGLGQSQNQAQRPGIFSQSTQPQPQLGQSQLGGSMWQPNSGMKVGMSFCSFRLNWY